MVEFNKLDDTSFPDIDTVDVWQYRNDYDFSKFKNPQMRIRLLSVPWDLGSVHVGQKIVTGIGNVVFFENANTRDKWFDSKRYATSAEEFATGNYDGIEWITDYRRYHSEDTMRLPVPYDVLARFNYVTVDYYPIPTASSPVDYETGDSIRKWYYFIRSFQMKASNTTIAEIYADLWTVYIYDMATKIKSMMLERGHAPLSMTNVTEYLNDPIDNNSYLLEEDVNFGELQKVAAHSEVVLNGGEMWAVIVTSSDPTANWGSADNSWTVPSRSAFVTYGVPSFYAMALEPEDLAPAMQWLDTNRPQFKQTVKGVFFIQRDLVTRLSTNYKLGDISYHLLGSANVSKDLLSLSKSQFGYSAEYSNLAKLYTYPYAAIEVCDDSGNSTLVKIEETTGKLSLDIASNVAFPYIALDAHLRGIGGSGSGSITFRGVTARSFDFSGRWYKHVKKWDVPVFAVTQNAAIDYAFRHYYERKQRALENETTQLIAKRNAKTAYDNALSSNATTQINALQSNSTAYNNAMNSATTDRDNALLKNDTSYDNAVNTASTEYENATASNATTNANAKASSLAAQQNAKASNATANTNAKASNATTNTNALARNKLAYDNAIATNNANAQNAYDSAGTVSANAKASNNTAEQNAKATSLTAQRNAKDSNFATAQNALDNNFATAQNALDSNGTVAKNALDSNFATAQNALDNNGTVAQNAYDLAGANYNNAIASNSTTYTNATATNRMNKENADENADTLIDNAAVQNTASTSIANNNNLAIQQNFACNDGENSDKRNHANDLIEFTTNDQIAADRQSGAISAVSNVVGSAVQGASGGAVAGPVGAAAGAVGGLVAGVAGAALSVAQLEIGINLTQSMARNNQAVNNANYETTRRYNAVVNADQSIGRAGIQLDNNTYNSIAAQNAVTATNANNAATIKTNATNTQTTLNGNALTAKNTADANALRTKNATDGNTERTKNTSDANANRTKDIADDNVERTRDTADTNASRTKDTADANANRTKDTADANADRTKATADANAERTRTTGNANADRTKTTTDTNTERTLTAANGNATRTKSIEDTADNLTKTTADANADRTKTTADANADRAKVTTDANADRTKATADANAERTFDNSLSVAELNKDTADAVATNEFDKASANTSRTKATADANANRTKDTADANAERTYATALLNIDQNKATSDAKLEAEQNGAALNAPVEYGGFSHGETALTRPIGMFANVITQSNNAIALAGDEFLRYGYRYSGAWKFDGDFNAMEKFTFWKCKDLWIDGLNAPDEHVDYIRFLLIGGVTVWRNPDDIGKTTIYENGV